MKKQWFPYWQWEDYQAGMYKPFCEERISDAERLLSDSVLFASVASSVITQWPISTEENLTNKMANRRAWLGQASCCFHCGASELTTRAAWANITTDARIEANRVADRLIDEYEAAYRSVHSPVGVKVLFKWGTRRDSNETGTAKQGPELQIDSVSDPTKRHHAKVAGEKPKAPKCYHDIKKAEIQSRQHVRQLELF